MRNPSSLLALLSAALCTAGPASAAPRPDNAGADAQVAEINARYQAVLAKLDEIDKQRRALDQLIARAHDLDDMRATGTVPVVKTKRQPESPTPVVGVERKDELDAQNNEMPNLPRVSNDVGGVLTGRHQLVIEPSMSYSYSSVSRVSIEGFTILPALLVGVIDVLEADRNTYMTSLSARYGFTNRFEMELRGSYLYRSDSTRSRQFLTDAVENSVFDGRGKGAGDWELGMRYQFNRRRPTAPYIVGNLRFKAANGSDPFELATQSALAGGPQFSKDLPTGSGFKSVSPSLTFVYPTDPVVFFGSIGYVWNEKDDKGITYDANDKPVGFGMVDPGDALRLNFGIGLGLNDRSSLSISYQLDKFSKTFIQTASVPDIVGSDVTVGKLLVGYSLRLPSGAPLNLAFGIGTTRDASDTDITFRTPISFGH